jgi:hypothetical protein
MIKSSLVLFKATGLLIVFKVSGLGQLITFAATTTLNLILDIHTATTSVLIYQFKNVMTL